MSSPYDGFKPAQTGLVDMGNISFYNTGATPIFNLAEVEPYGSSFSELVLNVTWAQLQPTANGPVVTSAIDSAIARKPKGHDFVIDRVTRQPAVGRHMSVTGG